MRNNLLDPCRVYGLSFRESRDTPYLRFIEYTPTETVHEFALDELRAEHTANEIYKRLQYLNSNLSEARQDHAPERPLAQLFSVEASHIPGTHFHLCPVSGDLFPVFRRWLAAQAEARNGEGGGHYRMHGSVASAMRLTWRSVAIPRQKPYVRECQAFLHAGGRFSLHCLGDACDVAIYPDGDRGADSGLPSRIDCHNVDWFSQQLTLLAGLAALHDLAAQELWRE